MLLTRPVFAQDTQDNSPLTVSDIIYADLATRHSLDNVSIYFSDGSSQDDVTINEQRHWLPASTVKMFAAMYAYKLISTGKLHLYDTVGIAAKNNVPTELVTDELPTLQIDETVTIDRLIRQMITQSDNTAYNQLLDVLGRDNITNYIVSLGLTHSHVGSKLNLDTSQEQFEFDEAGYGINTTTAQDYAKAFDLIKNNKIPGSKDLYAVLQKQKINNMIPLFLPKNVVCAHKTGDLDPLFHDGGICETKNGSYILSVFTNAGNPTLIAHLSELIYTKDPTLVGEALENKPISESPQAFPLDPLVLSQPSASQVLAAQTNSLQVPTITAADLGVTSEDLSLVLKDKDLPLVIIPADSPFHDLVNNFETAKRLLALDPKSKLDVDLEIGRLRLAEVKDLQKRGKNTQAQNLLGTLQGGLTAVSKEPELAKNATAQNQLQAISQTRFAIMSDDLKSAKGKDKIAAIKTIATAAKETIRNIAPNLPAATNATNPAQKPLIGEIISTSATQVTVKTAGGQVITVPIGSAAIKVKNKETEPLISPTPENISVTPSSTPNVRSLKVGTTVALIGSTTNNTFSPSLILTNIPKELAAPQPVTVAKVDPKTSVMVVVENGVFTQVNVGKNTIIKGADTGIELSQIKEGDVVVVHGEPLTPTKPKNQPEPTKLPNGTTPSPASTDSGGQSGNSSAGTATFSVGSTTQTTGNSQGTTGGTGTVQTQTVSGQTGQTNQTSGKSQTAGAPTANAPQSQPKVIQSTSIQVVEKKSDAGKSSPPPAQQQQSKPAEQPKHEDNKPQPQPQQQTAPAPKEQKVEDKKK